MEGSDEEELGSELWRLWLRRVVSGHGGATAVARLAEVPKQSLDNLLFARTKKPNLNLLQRVADACGEVMDWLPVETGSSSRSGSANYKEAELVHFSQSFPARSAPDFWRVKTTALVLEQIVLNDLIEFDFDLKPRRGDIVMASIDDGAGNLQKILRLYEPPFLLTRSSDRTIDRAPIEVDGKSVRICGVLRQLLRLRRSL